MFDEYYYDEDGIKRKKLKGRELQDIDVSEISLVNYPSTRRSFLICKSREEGKIMEEIFDYLEDMFGETLDYEFKKSMEEKAKEMPKEALEALKEAVVALWEYKDDYNEQIKSALKVLASFIPGKYPAPGGAKYPYPVKKGAAEWPSVIDTIFGGVYLQKSDLKPSPGNKFPSITQAIEDKKQAMLDYLNEEDDE